jgi:hypothetical protein
MVRHHYVLLMAPENDQVLLCGDKRALMAPKEGPICRRALDL